MAKYQQQYQEMVQQHQQLFDEFKKVHDLYAQNKSAHQQEFNDRGEPVLDLIQQYENRLCRKSERGGYSQYSAQLAEKFWGLVRKHYPLIDSVGLKAT